jgi:hypothetical protein
MNRKGSWERDTKPYLIIGCVRCHNHFYVNLTKRQKIKTCPQCKKKNLVNKAKGVMVEGMTAAVKKVKEKQHELALNELGREPSFEVVSGKTFEIANLDRQKKNVRLFNSKYTKTKNSEKFKEGFIFLRILKDIAQEYTEFPIYLVEYKAREAGLPVPEIKIYLRQFVKQEILSINKKKYLVFSNKEKLREIKM